jgi:hypothetical protein
MHPHSTFEKPLYAMLRTLLVCTCGESVSGEEVAADQDIMQCKVDSQV